ncbi:MAG TPA: secretin N-terminal domain-containing protein [Burkholderiales bacterium]|nr:secretin N-terminal domain-containing protein [Burkholderiales bacterium]
MREETRLAVALSASVQRASPAVAAVGATRLAGVLLALTVSACAYRPTVPPSEGHLSAERVPTLSKEERVLPPVTVSDFVSPPRPQVRTPTYSVVVHEVPVKELLFALARDTKQNIDVHPGVQGLVSLNAIDETLPAILERVAQQTNIRYRTEGKTIVVAPDTPYFKTYRVNYVNVSRETSATIGVSGDITSGSATGQSGGASAQNESSSSTRVESASRNNFWEALTENISSILAATKALTETAEQRAARGEAARAARQERIAQAEAVSRAGENAPSLYSAAFGAEQTTRTEAKDEIVVNPIAGTVAVLGTEKQHTLVQQYLDAVTSASQRQVLIEATIAEVQLSNAYQAGVDWSRIAANTGFTFRQEMLGTNLGTAPRMLIGYANPTSEVGNIAASIRMLEQFGNTRVLSSPKLMALNNQSAILKVVDNVVYFEIDAQTTASANVAAITTFSTTARTVPVGLIMSVLPQITEAGSVNLTVRPTISRVVRFINDPNPALRLDGQGQPLADPIQNQVPEIQVREMESMLQVGSGQTVILGGLMQDDVRRDRDQIPGLGSVSRIGEAFSYRDEDVRKTELIVFLKPTVINNPSLDSDELKYFQRFLPQIDPSGQNP